jgi:hypothetical protein
LEKMKAHFWMELVPEAKLYSSVVEKSEKPQVEADRRRVRLQENSVVLGKSAHFCEELPSSASIGVMLETT